MGTVASNITQTVSFYNTTGVIEKEHNLYYCPRVSAGSPSAWLTAFSSAVSTITGYSNISISQWSPEDRVLSIKGRIENFRVSSGLNPLNYCIVTQTVSYDDLTTATFYYAYFIVGARQNGVGAVTLELEPDHFTNVFFLQNTNSSDANFDTSFNRMLKNTYVERQHYDRVQRGITNKITISEYTLDTTDQEGNLFLDFEYPKSELGGRAIVGASVDSVTDLQGGDIQYQERVEISDEGNFYLLSIVISAPSDQDTQVRVNISVTAGELGFEDINLPLFANYEETFRFRRQYRDSKRRLLYELTPTEEAFIENGISWNNMSDTLKLKLVKQSACVLHNILKNRDIIMPYVPDIEHINPRGLNIVYQNSNIPKALVDVQTLVCNVPDKFRAYKSNIEALFKGEYYITRLYNNEKYYQKCDFEQLQNLPNYPQYISTSYISKDDYLINRITLEEVNLPYQTQGLRLVINSVTVEFDYNKVLDDIGIACVYYYENLTDIGAFGYFLNYRQDSTTGKRYSETGAIKILDSSVSISTVNLLVSVHTGYVHTEQFPNKGKSTITNYYEPILTFAPYSYYSVSYLGNIEVPLNKLNYYQTGEVNFDIVISVTDALQVSVVPTYSIEGKKFKYYTEELTITLNNQLPFVSALLDEYLAQNRAQMKNQYAINEISGRTALIKNTVGGITSGVKAGFMGGAEAGGVVGLTEVTGGLITSYVTMTAGEEQIKLSQQAKLADLGNLPNNVKQTGTDINTDLSINEMGLYLNHYTIDEVSYNNICRYLERYGYLINIYDTLKILSRKGWNYIKLVDFEFDTYISEAQEESIRQIFKNGVTLLHEPSYLHNNAVHNYEIILD